MHIIRLYLSSHLMRPVGVNTWLKCAIFTQKMRNVSDQIFETLIKTLTKTAQEGNIKSVYNIN